jgi:hypothetical protein
MNAVALSLLAAALAVTVSLEVSQIPNGASPAANNPPKPKALPSGANDGTSFSMPSKDVAQGRLATILARPLFAPARRPPAGAATTEEGLPRLAGVIIGPDIRRAIFAPAKGSATVVTEGGRTAGYDVHAIGPNEVILSGPDGEHRLRTGYAKAGPIKPQIIEGRDPTSAAQN